jgi:hypothetical protein
VNQQENIEVKAEEEVDEDERGLCVLHSEVVKVIKEKKNKEAT